MNREDIIRIAREAGWIIRDDLHYMDHQAIQDALIERIERFAALVTDAECEACAKVCEENWEIDGTHTAKEFASAIRARRQA